jgi:hypothetical protein
MAIKTVNILTLPINIVKIRINLLSLLKSEVIPLLRPTVLYAEIHSKEIFNNPRFESNKEIRKIEIKITIKERTIIAKALFTVVPEISLLNTSRRDFPLAILKMLRIAIAKVLVLMPPPVEPGDAPIHMSKITINVVGMFNDDVSTVLKPAVLEVTEPKNEVTNLPIKL